MRTTLTLDDKLAKSLKELAYRSGKPFKQVIDETLRSGLSAGTRRVRSKPYRLKPCSLGGVVAGFHLDKALQLSDRLEDEEIARKLRMKK